MFVHYLNTIVNADRIERVICDDYIKEGVVYVYLIGQDPEVDEADVVHGPEATNLIMALCPSVLEGKQAKYKRNAWAIHNLIGHPLMQLLSWVGLTRLGIKVHDATVPDESHE